MDCNDQELGRFTLDGDFNIADTLVAAGFPHIEVNLPPTGHWPVNVSLHMKLSLSVSLYWMTSGRG